MLLNDTGVFFQAVMLLAVTVPIAVLAGAAYRRAAQRDGLYYREMEMSKRVDELAKEVADSHEEIKLLRGRLAEQEKQMASFRLSAARCQAAQVALLEAASSLSDQLRSSGIIPSIDISTLASHIQENA